MILARKWVTPDGQWRLDEIHLSLITQSEGIAGNGLPPLEGWQLRVRANGQRTLLGYLRLLIDEDKDELVLTAASLARLRDMMGDDFIRLEART